MEPAPVGRRGARLQHVVERPEPAPGVVEHAVEDDPHVAIVGGVQQLAQRGVAAQQRVDRHVVVGVIAMVRGRREDRRQVQRVDAEIGQVVEMLDDPEQVAALEPVVGRWRRPTARAARACGPVRSPRTDPGRSGRRSRRGPRPGCRRSPSVVDHGGPRSDQGLDDVSAGSEVPRVTSRERRRLHADDQPSARDVAAVVQQAGRPPPATARRPKRPPRRRDPRSGTR